MKAFARLAERLRKNYPQLSLCLCFDALYANGTAMDICHKNHWKYFITFKEGSLPALWQEYQSLLAMCPRNRKTHTTDDGVRQNFAWVGQLEHVDDQNRRHRVNAFQCQEKHDGQTRFERGNLLTQDARQLFGSLANLARRLAESIRNVLIAADALDPANAAKIQIRFDTS